MTRREQMRGIIEGRSEDIPPLGDHDEDWPGLPVSSYTLLYIRAKLIELDRRMREMEAQPRLNRIE
jgi:hypothetical protein